MIIKAREITKENIEELREYFEDIGVLLNFLYENYKPDHVVNLEKLLSNINFFDDSLMCVNHYNVDTLTDLELDNYIVNVYSQGVMVVEDLSLV